MLDRFDINAPTIHKYVDIVCDVLCDKGKLFDKYISTPFGEWILGIIHQFKELIDLWNICGAIDGTHISLVERPSIKYTFVVSYYYNWKKNS